mmetsp:Transcript_95875/g.240298  ORF Transcript_95875/g.240298 Transcript_95875/m.240298 type:complete len:219 (+) Transcript_95875:498-1154(+)
MGRLCPHSCEHGFPLLPQGSAPLLPHHIGTALRQGHLGLVRRRHRHRDHCDHRGGALHVSRPWRQADRRRAAALGSVGLRLGREGPHGRRHLRHRHHHGLCNPLRDFRPELRHQNAVADGLHSWQLPPLHGLLLGRPLVSAERDGAESGLPLPALHRDRFLHRCFRAADAWRGPAERRQGRRPVVDGLVDHLLLGLVDRMGPLRGHLPGADLARPHHR